MNPSAPPLLHQRIQNLARLFEAFESRGFRLYLVGGAVRDALMGLPLGKDCDLCTNARPQDTLRILRTLRLPTWDVGARFGTIAARWDDPQLPIDLEITTFRAREAYTEGSRRPDVVFGDHVEEDLHRRDLSINAMACDATGQLIDPWNGQQDILQRDLQPPGGGFDHIVEVLREDALRILRIARFAARLDFTPTEDTTRAALHMAANLSHISHERWKAELEKTLAAPHLAVGWTWLSRIGAWQAVWPALHPLHLHPELDQRLLAVLLRAPRAFLPRLAIALHAAWWLAREPAWTGHHPPPTIPPDELPKVVQDLCLWFRLSGDERHALLHLLGPTPPPDALREPWTDAALRRAWQAPRAWLPDRWRVLAAWMPDASDLQPHIEARVAQLQTLEAQAPLEPKLPSGVGHCIAQHFGLRGPALGQALQRLREAILDGHLANPPSTEACITLLADTSDP